MTDEIKLWNMGAEQVLTVLEPVSQLATEWQLEEMLVAHPELLESGIELVGRQTPAAGGWLDLLGVDADGRLVIYELKRGTLGREAVTQVLDYASFLSEMDSGALVEHINDRSGQGGIQSFDDFAAWYEDRFADTEHLYPLRMVLVGVGIDETALRLARFLSQGSLDVEVITFYGFRNGDETLIARQQPVQSEASVPRKISVLPIDERRRLLDQYLEQSGMAVRFKAVRGAIRECLPTSVYEHPQKFGVSLQMDVRGSSGVRGPRPFFGVYAAYTSASAIEISLNSVTRRHNPEDYEVLAGRVPLVAWPNGGQAIVVDDDEQWERVKPAVTEFAAAVYKSWLGYRNTPMNHTADHQDTQ